MPTDKTSQEAFSMEERRKTLRKFRKQLGLSQADIAKLAGIGQQMLSRFERGDRDLSPAAFERLEKAVNDALQKRKSDATKATQFATLSSLGRPQTMADYGPTPNFFSLQVENEKLKERLEIAEQVIGIQGTILKRRDAVLAEVEKVLRDAKIEFHVKDTRIKELERQVKELRGVWDAGVEAALAHEKFERLREKVSAADVEKD